MAAEKVKLFVGWSKARSKALAMALCDWLPKVIQATDPWMSENDVAAGARWGGAIAERLHEADFGIICLTPENMSNPWVLFEAGALSNKFPPANTPEVCAYLLDLTAGEVKQPLGQFQHIEAKSKDKNHRLLKTINSLLGEDGLPEKALDDSFNKWWPDMEAKTNEIGPPETPTEEKRTAEDILSELLSLSRATNAFIERQPNRPGSAFSSDFSQDFGAGVGHRRTHAQRASEMLERAAWQEEVLADARAIIDKQFGEGTSERLQAKKSNDRSTPD